jgi:AhpD family alkylhydroperoxidase
MARTRSRATTTGATTEEMIMDTLSPRERELVAIGASLASHCVPCIAYHVAKAKKLGLTEAQIDEAVALADKVRQVPARAVLEAARRTAPTEQGIGGCGCGATES